MKKESDGRLLTRNVSDTVRWTIFIVMYAFILVLQNGHIFNSMKTMVASHVQFIVISLVALLITSLATLAAGIAWLIYQSIKNKDEEADNPPKQKEEL